MQVQQVKKGVFMNESPLQQLIALVKLDQKILILERKIASLQDQVAKLEEEKALMERDLAAAKQHMRAAKKTVDQKELRMKELAQDEQETKQRLEAVKGQREYEVLIKHLKAVQKNQHDFEDELLDSWKLFELAQKQYEQKMQEVSAHTQELEAALTEKQQEVEALKKESAQLATARPAKEVLIAEELLSKYKMMRQQVTDPVVPMQQASCSACFYHVLPQDKITIERGGLKQCHNCFRFLYHEAAHTE